MSTSAIQLACGEEINAKEYFPPRTATEICRGSVSDEGMATKTEMQTDKDEQGVTVTSRNTEDEK